MSNFGADQHGAEVGNSVAAVAWALWFCLLCQCETCGDDLKIHSLTSEWDALCEADAAAWANAIAPSVHALGWRTCGEFELLCPRCAASPAR